MKTIATLIVLATAILAGQARADVHVKGYVKKDGTYVQPHYRSNPDGNFQNNWSTYGNTNPYTGTMGTRKAPQGLNSYRTPSYGFRDYSTYRSPSYGNTYNTPSPQTYGNIYGYGNGGLNMNRPARTPSFNFNTPSLWNSRTPQSPSLTQPMFRQSEDTEKW